MRQHKQREHTDIKKWAEFPQRADRNRKPTQSERNHEVYGFPRPPCHPQYIPVGSHFPPHTGETGA